ncbi:MAG: undecaprenyl-diphosphate phosphatase [Deltaproteobacteria bacterium]|nr:undecaprenyl-diphosphate phosphatase [Deltaproteobacteria bacterium]
MKLVEGALWGAIQGLTTVVPISSSGHLAAAEIWLGSPPGRPLLSALGEIGTLCALVVVLRTRLARACAAGIRGIARPSVLQHDAGGRDAIAVAVAALVSAAAQVLLGPLVAPWRHVPALVGAGLLLGAVALGLAALAPPPRRICPGAPGAALVGLAHGLGVVPGGSPVGGALVVLCWLGAGGWRGAELALLASGPPLALGAARGLLQALQQGQSIATSLGAAAAVAALLGAGVAAALGTGLVRWLCATRRVAWLGLWMIPLGAATAAYGCALP